VATVQSAGATGRGGVIKWAPHRGRDEMGTKKGDAMEWAPQRGHDGMGTTEGM